MHQVIRIHPAAPPKPPVDAPCNGCGVCCAAEPCPVGMVLSRRRHGACVALQWNDTEARYRCGVVVEPARHLKVPRWLARPARRLAMRFISAGSGCDCSMEVERPA